MGKLAARDVQLARAVARELAVVRVDGPPAMREVLPEIRAALDVEAMASLCPIEQPRGWAVEHFESSGFDAPRKFENMWLTFFKDAPRRYAWYDPLRPEPWQRDRVIDALDIIPEGELESSRVYAQVLAPLRLHRHHQLRVLVCDGASLLAWFGTFQSERPTPRQRRLLAAVAPAVRKRLALERRLHGGPRVELALDAALDRLGAPAYVLDAAGRVREANRSGEALLAARGRDVRRALRDAIARRPADLAFEITPLGQRAAPTGWLALLAARSADAQIADAVAVAAARWGLSRRRQQVLELVVRGDPTTTIAANLGVSERAIELHLTALFDRAGVENRVALVSRVLRGRG